MMQTKQNSLIRLAVAAALAGGAVGAHAALTAFGGGTFNANKAANELPTNGFTMLSGGTGAAGDLTAGGAMTSFVPSSGQSLTVNVTLDNGAKFSAAANPVLLCSAVGGYVSATVPTLGGNGSNQAVYSIAYTDVSSILGNSNSGLNACYVSAAGISVTGVHTSPNMSITFTYGNLASSVVSGPYMQYSEGLSASKTTGPAAVALVGSGFVSLSGGSTQGIYTLSAGGVSWNGGANSASYGTLGTLIATSNALASGSITIAGASLAATKATAGIWLQLPAAGACTTGGAGLVSVTGGATSVTFNTGLSASIMDGGVNVCMAFDGVTPIPAGSITATVGGTAIANYSLPSPAALTLMTVSRNGSSTEVLSLPSSTNTDAGYLRVYNNSSVGGAVTVTMYNEAGTALATNCNLGTLSAQSTLVDSVGTIETTCGVVPLASGRYRMVVNGAFSTMRAQGLARTGGVLVNLSADTSSSGN